MIVNIKCTYLVTVPQHFDAMAAAKIYKSRQENAEQSTYTNVSFFDNMIVLVI